ncbi:LOW QUALITY PROTEIN: hypothetical protein QYF61_023896 [Mycteria americana]|uniref:Uncharacterized protein n=1 Tax=Mycteria americana TaxID=33587 RepID=A0AAN7NIP2_MYCAM|nr:LOW QUALITY PROTEIN: hypothetical protein QYF61_023896 [Mycteria americana]
MYDETCCEPQPGKRGPTLNTAFEVRPHQCRVQGHDHFPSPAGHTISDTSQDAIGFLGHLGTLLAHIQVAVNKHPQVLLCWAAFQPLFPKPVALHGVAVAQVQDLALGPVEPHTIDLGPLIQPVQVPLQSLPPLQQINTPTQLGVICKVTEGALDPFVQIIDKDIKQDWPQHRALGNTACDRPPTGVNSIHHHSLGPAIQPVLYPEKSTPVQAMSSQFLQENAVGNHVKGFTSPGIHEAVTKLSLGQKAIVIGKDISSLFSMEYRPVHKCSMWEVPQDAPLWIPAYRCDTRARKDSPCFGDEGCLNSQARLCPPQSVQGGRRLRALPDRSPRSRWWLEVSACRRPRASLLGPCRCEAGFGWKEITSRKLKDENWYWATKEGATSTAEVGNGCDARVEQKGNRLDKRKKENSDVKKAKQPQVPQLLLIRLVLQTLPQLRCPSLDTLQPLNVSLRGPKLNTVFEVRPHQCRVQGHDHFPSPAGHAIFDTSQDAIGFLGHLATLLAHIQAAVNQHPQVLFCLAAFQPLFPKPVALHGVAVAQVQDLALGLVEPHTIDLGPSIQPVQVPLQSLPTLQQINTPTQLGVICKLTEGALDPFVQIIDKDVKQNWPQHRALGNTACDRPPTGVNSIHHHSLGPAIQPVLYPAKSTPVQAMSSQFLQENAVGNHVKGFTEV